MSAERLSDAGVPDPVESSEHLLAKAVGCGPQPSDLRRFLACTTAPQFRRSTAAADTQCFEDEFEALIQRRLRREPVQMIVGDWDFCSATLEVSPGVLCPRPETEELVGHCLDSLATCEGSYDPEGLHPPRILDVGSGTGAIGIAVLVQHPTALVDAIDIDAGAVALAKRNAMANGIEARYRCMHADVGWFEPEQLYDTVVANPPYIPECERDSLAPEVLLYEPESSLFGGSDGLDCIRLILRRLTALLLPGGHCWIECDSSHPRLLEAMLGTPQDGAVAEAATPQDYPDLELLRTARDFAGLPRFVCIRRRVAAPVDINSA